MGEASINQLRPRIGVSLIQSGELLSYEVASDFTILDLKSFINAETGIEPSLMILSFNGQPLINDAQTLEQAGVNDNDMLAVDVRSSQQQQVQQPARTSQHPRTPAQEQVNTQIEGMRQQLLSNAQARAEFTRQAPEVASAINDPTRFREAVIALEQSRRDEEAARIARLNDDVNEENQAAIAEHIRMENIERERMEVMHSNPECKLGNNRHTGTL